jgi:hypothetical protein
VNDTHRHTDTHTRVRGRSTSLTEALGPLSAPVAHALAGEHGGQGQLVPLVTGVADARAPDEVRAHHLAVGDDGGWGTHDGCRGNNYGEGRNKNVVSIEARSTRSSLHPHSPWLSSL